MGENNPEQPDPPFEEGILKVLHVVPGVGPYHTIQEAVNAALPGTRILVASALYTQQVVVNKPGLVLEAREPNCEVQITCASGPIIAVSLQAGENCCIRGFKLIHTAVSSKRLEPLGNSVGEVYMDIFEGTKNTEHWIRGFKISRNMNCALWVDGGHVLLEDCQVTLSSAKTSLPAIVVSSGHLVIEKCDVKGHGEIPSVGVYLSESDLTVKNSKIFRHRGGGLVLYGNNESKVHVSDSQVIGNVNCGVYCIGEEFKPVIQRSKISHNEGTGVKVGLFNCAVVKGCEIKQNEKGVEVEGGDPFIFLNIIKGNREEGVSFKSMGEFRCDGKLMSNDVFENECGVVCAGSLCHPVIEGNGKIAANRKAGVRVSDGAHVSIIRNVIHDNSTQGILLVKGSSAHIEKNIIYSNTKANIAFGGCENSDTTIIDNTITKGHSEGIFNLEGGTSWIKRNKIQENSDGIVLIDSHPIVTGNFIYENRRSGITVAGKSQPSILENEIARNTAVGVNIRDLASGLVLRNNVTGNLVQMALITKTKMNLKEIKQENVIGGEIQLPLPTICNLL